MMHNVFYRNQVKTRSIKMNKILFYFYIVTVNKNLTESLCIKVPTHNCNNNWDSFRFYTSLSCVMTWFTAFIVSSFSWKWTKAGHTVPVLSGLYVKFPNAFPAIHSHAYLLIHLCTSAYINMYTYYIVVNTMY